MRAETNIEKLKHFMAALGESTTSPGRIYLTGGASALLYAWRPSTIDIDIKASPEPAGLFEAIMRLKDEIDVNVELASPDQFIPEIPGWHERSIFILRHGQLDFHHYDFYSQALAKIERGHARDLSDVKSMVNLNLIVPSRILDFFKSIEPLLIRYPAITPSVFRSSVEAFCSQHSLK